MRPDRIQQADVELFPVTRICDVFVKTQLVVRLTMRAHV
jgi:hypothetical protein